MPCKWSIVDLWSSGRGKLTVNAMFSINNIVTGGIETGGVPANSSVVEILVEGSGLHDERNKRDCDGESSESIDDQLLGFDCHFYEVALNRPGVYIVDQDRHGQSGVCMLILR